MNMIARSDNREYSRYIKETLALRLMEFSSTKGECMFVMASSPSGLSIFPRVSTSCSIRKLCIVGGWYKIFWWYRELHW